MRYLIISVVYVLSVAISYYIGKDNGYWIGHKEVTNIFKSDKDKKDDSGLYIRKDSSR